MSIQKVIKTTKKGKSIRWRAFLPPLNGKRESKLCQSKKEAEQWRAEQLAARTKIQAGIFLDEESTVSEFFETWMTQHVKKRRSVSTQKRYQGIFNRRIEPYIGHIKACSLHPTEAEEWFGILADQVDDEDVRLSAATANSTLNMLKSIYNWGIRHHLLLLNPATAVELLDDPNKDDFDYWEKQEVTAFLNACKNSEYYLLYLTALNTGMRLHELVGLQRDCVDLMRNAIVVKRSWCNKEQKLKNTTKGKRKRRIPIPKVLRPLLVAEMMRLPAECPWIFSLNGERIPNTHNFCSRVFKPTCRAVGVREIRFHDLRHTYASHYVMNGGNIYMLQAILGHRTIKTTERYAHLSPDHLQQSSTVVSFEACDERIALVEKETKK